MAFCRPNLTCDELRVGVDELNPFWFNRLAADITV
jgi:hypothetical protein